MEILITGGAGYIGSTIASALEDAGHIPIILDSLVTGRAEFTRGRAFYQGDVADRALLERVFAEHPAITACVHCAALIVVPESTAKPYEYYRENVVKSLELFRNLHALGCRNVVFSSSGSVYDEVPGFRVAEDAPLRPVSPYARTKFMMEMILRDFCAAYGMRGIALRYFNPIGADPQLRTGLQLASPSLVLGKLVEVQLGRQKEFVITGTDYPTRDGTGLRDYIHVWDLAQAHVAAVTDFEGAFARAGGEESYLVINLGTGTGVTVRELVEAFKKVTGKPLNVVEGARRPGDSAGAYASCEKAKAVLGWQTKLSIEDGIRDALRWGEQRVKVLGY